MSISDASVALSGTHSIHPLLLHLGLFVGSVLGALCLPMISLSTDETSILFHRRGFAVHSGFPLVRTLVEFGLSSSSPTSTSGVPLVLFLLREVGFASALELKVPTSTSSSATASPSTSALGGYGRLPGFGRGVYLQSIEPFT